MGAKSEQDADISDSFEALLRQAAYSPPPDRQRLAGGTKLAGGRFEITRRIGEGGMGVVYEAFDAERGGKVALKTLSRLEPAAIYRLKNEFRALADVAHPNLVRLHELFAEGALWFFTMDLIDGVRFDDWVRTERTLDEARLRAALPELLHAVLAIHDAGKLHRDLKPSNVLVTREGRVVALDFGLAVDPELGGVGQTVANDSVSGTPAYMAPEQAAGEPATSASDLYALGVMLFEALTGKLPFEGRAGEMIAAKQRDAAPDPRALFAGAPPDLATLCAALLQREPSARPSAAALSARFAAKDRESSRSSVAPHVEEFVGREAELGALHDAFRAASIDDKPVIVLLSGESGIGKSALLERFLGELRARGRAVVLSGQCYERESVPFKGFDVLIDELSRYLRRLSALETTALVPREVSALRRLFPVLGRIDAIASAPERTVADAFELRRRGFLALGELFSRMRDRQPLVIAIDDLQWSDRDSTALLLHLVRQADAPRLLLVASHRSENMRENPVLTPLYDTLEVDIRLDVRKLSVGPLHDEAAAALVGNAGEAAQTLVREAGGNPFLLRELARARPGKQGRSLAQILGERVAGLPTSERALLEVMAVAARPLPLELAATAAAIQPARAAFDGLRSKQLARSGAQPGSVECYHDRVREAVAAGLGADAARAYHAALAKSLLQTADPDPDHLSEHFELAGDTRLAADYAVRAADRAARGFAFDQAGRLYDKALSLAAFEPLETQRLRVALADALSMAGLGVMAAEAFLRAREGAPAAEAAQLVGKAAAEYLTSGRLARGRELLAEGLRSLGMSLPRTPARAAAMLVLSRARLRVRGLGLAPRHAEPEVRERIAALDRIVQALAGIDVLSCAALNARVLRLALDAGDAELVVNGLHHELWNRALGVGGAARVPELSRHARSLIERLPSPNPRLEAWHDFFLGNYEYMARSDGNLEEALRRFDRFVAAAHANPSIAPANYRALGHYERVTVLSLLGRYAEVARELPALLDDAWQRSDLVLIPLLTIIAALAWPAIGAEAEAARTLDRAEHAWSALENPYAYQDTMMHAGRCILLHYRGNTRAAWAACLAHDARFLASFAKKAAIFSQTVYSLRGGTAAALAAETTNASERTALISEAKHALSALRSRPETPPYELASLRAAIACAERDRERAVRVLREASSWAPMAGFPPYRFYAMRRHLGVLLGGDEGAALVSEADSFFRNGGAVDPERLAAAIIGGCKIH